jgi:hypothetical protein
VPGAGQDGRHRAQSRRRKLTLRPAAFAPGLAGPAPALLWDGRGIGADTMLTTPFGPVPAGRLRPGDRVLGPGGVVQALTRVLRIDLPGAAFRRLGLPRPVGIAAGALGFGMPAGPLVVGPAQCVRLDGGWIRADVLVDQRAIRPVEAGLAMVALRHDGAGPVLAAGVPVDFGGEAGPDVAAAVASLLRIGASARRRPEIDGYVDIADRTALHGWAIDRSRPGCVVPLEVLVDGAVVAQAITDLPRPDLGGVGSGGEELGGWALHGFAVRFPAPLSAGRRWMVEVRHAGGGPALPGTPLVFDAAAGSAMRFDTALAALGSDAAAAATLAGIVEAGAGRRRR